MKTASLFCVLLLMTGCASLWGGEGRQGVSSSLVDYLYPQGEVPPRQDGVVPNLNLPLHVGLAFVPSRSGSDQVLTEAYRVDLLNRVKAAFAGRDYIREITVIPDAYMRSGKGFAALEQTARLYDIDVMALVSYDQVAHSDETKASFLYWTIVGAYLIKGNKNEVQTFVDTAVFDVPTRKLLFRAPGVNKVESSSTLVDVERDTRKAREAGFERAMTDMTVSLDKELAAFKERIKTDRSVTVSRAGGEGGGGAVEPAMLLLAGLVLFVRRRLAKAC
ncbi:MAG: delta endotoxin [Steroidobacteraceae bacterium]|nr:delta endotoxin [Steroidobacteraceae bacterium]